MAIRQGTTPTHTFTVEMDASDFKTVHIAYAQCNEVLFIRRDSDITLQGHAIITTLTQEETLMIDPDKIVAIQIRAVTYAGEAFTSDIMLVSAEMCLEKDVIE